MINKEWVRTQIVEASKSNPNITDETANQIQDLIYDQLISSQLSSKELNNRSISLLEKLGLFSSEMDKIDEN